MYLRSRSHINKSMGFMVLMRFDHLCINYYIISLLTIILIPILMVWVGLKPAYTACVSDALAN